MTEYRWLDKDPVVDFLRTAFQRDGRRIRDIAVASHLNPKTIDNLLYGKTRRPQHRTVTLLFESLGVKQRYFFMDSGEELHIAQDIWRKFIKRKKERKAA